MDLYGLLMRRRSVRHFQERTVSDDLLDRLLDAAANAPSGGNIQPLSVVVVRERERRVRLAEIVGGQPWVANAPLSLVFCLDFSRVKRWAKLSGVAFMGERALSVFLIAFADVMCAAQSVVILAESLGLGSVYVGTVLSRIDEAREHLRLPELVLPVMVLSVGYPKSIPTTIRKLDRTVIAHDEVYRSDSDEEIERAFSRKYGSIEENVEKYLERAFVEVVEADKQGDGDWVGWAREKMDELNIRNSAQFLFDSESRMQEAMKKMLESKEGHAPDSLGSEHPTASAGHQH